MTPHYIVSDLHLADGTRRDDFKKNRTKFKNFLRMVKKQKAQLIIAGDFLELWQTNPIDIARTYSDILNELISIGTKIIIGNHDYYLHHFRKLNFLYDSYQIPDTKIFIQHGHQFDRFNDPKRLIHIGNLAAMSAGIMEDIHPDLDETAMSFLEALHRKLKSALSPIHTPGTNRRQYISHGGNFSEYLAGAKKLLKKYDYVILGHTHKPGTASEGRYLNAGSWTSSKPTYVEVEHDGHCTLKYWSTQSPVKKLLNKK
jgi:UDP-2,3-diacylglucosamine pyrophosphatase LpxH